MGQIADLQEWELIYGYEIYFLTLQPGLLDLNLLQQISSLGEYGMITIIRLLYRLLQTVRNINHLTCCIYCQRQESEFSNFRQSRFLSRPIVNLKNLKFFWYSSTISLCFILKNRFILKGTFLGGREISGILQISWISCSLQSRSWKPTCKCVGKLHANF